MKHHGQYETIRDAEEFKTSLGEYYEDNQDVKFYFTHEGNSANKIQPYSTKSCEEIKDTYESRLQTINKIMVFVFDAQVLETTPWDTIKSNYLVLKRYDLTIEDLDSLNWLITYQ